MGAFGAEFDLKAFKAASDSNTDMDAYNRAQAVERALGREGAELRRPARDRRRQACGPATPQDRKVASQARCPAR